MAGPTKLEELGAGGDVAGLLRVAAHPRRRAGAGAASRLAEMEPSDAAPEVRAALTDGSDPIRCAAVRVLYDWHDAKSLAEAVFWLPRDGASRRLALAAIARLENSECAPVLAGSLVAGTAEDVLWEDEVELVLRLCRSNPNGRPLREVLDVLVEAFEVEYDTIAARAEEFLIWLGEAAVPAVTTLAQLNAAPARAVWVLGQIGGATVVHPLIEAVDHPDARTREEACVALGELRDPIAVDALVRATRDPEHRVRVAAGSALDRIGTVAALSAIVPGLRRPARAARGAGGGQNGTTRGSRQGARVKPARQ